MKSNTIPRTVCSPISFATLEVFCSDTQLPATCINDKGENVIINRESYGDAYCYRLDIYQKNDWIRTNRYYLEGEVDETYDK